MFSVFILTSYSTETDPRCSSPVDSGSSDADKQAKQKHEKSGECSPSPYKLSSVRDAHISILKHWLIWKKNKDICSAFCLSDVTTSSGACPEGEGRKAPLVASDSSSSGGSDSEEDDKNAGGPHAAAITSETVGAPGNKTADLKRFASFSWAASLSDAER